MPWGSSEMLLALSSSRRSSTSGSAPEQAIADGGPTPPSTSSLHQEEEPAVKTSAAVATSSSEASPIMTSMRSSASSSAPRRSSLPASFEHQSLSSSSAAGGARNRSPMPSGLSFLIQAATQLTEQATSSKVRAFVSGSGSHSADEHHPPDPWSGTTTDDGASSDGGGGGNGSGSGSGGGAASASGGATSRKPTMILPEPDPTKQSFPELLMTLALDPKNEDTIAFLPDGKFFAVRAKQFLEEIMIHYFTVTTFDEFLDLAYDWGFTRILTQDQPNDNHGIEVFRHPQFIKGEWAKCALMKFGETPTDARLSALPDRARIEYTMSDESSSPGPGGAGPGAGSAAVPGGPHSKRRLSPGFIKRRESEGSLGAAVPKKRHSLEGSSGTCPQHGRSASVGRADSDETGDIASYTNHSRSDDIRSVALALTTEKLNLRNDTGNNGAGGHDHGGDSSSSSKRLVDQAVKSATYTIVTDAIETLLHDESHTKETYLKHEKELSTSCLPGVVPISKQLFEPRKDGSTNMSLRKPPGEVVATTTTETAQAPPPPPPTTAASTAAGTTTTTTLSTSSTTKEPSTSAGENKATCPSATANTANTTSTTTTTATRLVTRRRRSMPEFSELRRNAIHSDNNAMTPIGDFLKIPSGLTSQANSSSNRPLSPPAPAIVSTTTSTTLAS
jgi:HSF-type DNA-binding